MSHLFSSPEEPVADFGNQILVGQESTKDIYDQPGAEHSKPRADGTHPLTRAPPRKAQRVHYVHMYYQVQALAD